MNCIQIGDGEFAVLVIKEKQKPYQQSQKVFTCPPPEFIPVYQFCTDYFILQMAGTQLNYLNQPAKNNRSDIIAHRNASCRERKYTHPIQSNS